MMLRHGSISPLGGYGERGPLNGVITQHGMAEYKAMDVPGKASQMRVSLSACSSAACLGNSARIHACCAS